MSIAGIAHIVSTRSISGFYTLDTAIIDFGVRRRGQCPYPQYFGVVYTRILQQYGSNPAVSRTECTARTPSTRLSTQIVRLFTLLFLVGIDVLYASMYAGSVCL